MKRITSLSLDGTECASLPSSTDGSVQHYPHTFDFKSTSRFKLSQRVHPAVRNMRAANEYAAYISNLIGFSANDEEKMFGTCVYAPRGRSSRLKESVEEFLQQRV
jgi:hypothetical protein